MAQPFAKSFKEYAAVVGLTFVTWLLSRVVPVFQDIFGSFGVALPLSTRIVLAGSPVYRVLFVGSSATLACLIVESVGWDGGCAEKLRHGAFAVLEKIAGRRAAQLQNMLIAGTLTVAAMFFVCAVFTVFHPMILMSNMSESPPVRSAASSEKK